MGYLWFQLVNFWAYILGVYSMESSIPEFRVLLIYFSPIFGLIAEND